jgi:hypothetical protein
MVGGQFDNFTPSPSFGHNLCFKCLNGSCEPLLDISVPRAFQWYKELFNLVGFDPYNRSLKIWESIVTPTPKKGVHLGVWRFNSHTFEYSQPPRSMKCDSLASLLARTFVSPCLGHEPKARVPTLSIQKLKLAMAKWRSSSKGKTYAYLIFFTKC